MISKLDDEDFDTRERAFHELLEFGEAIVAPVQALLAKKTTGPELAARAEALLLFRAPGPPTQNGLRIWIGIDRASAAPGDLVTMTTTLVNVTGHELTIGARRGLKTTDAFATGAYLRVSREGDGEHRTNLMGENAGTIGVGITGQRLVTLPAWSLKKYQVSFYVPYPKAKTGETAAPTTDEKPVDTSTDVAQLLLPGESKQWVQTRGLPVNAGALADGATHRIYIEYSDTRRSTPGDNTTYWKGTIRSNEVQLTIKAEQANSAPAQNEKAP